MSNTFATVEEVIKTLDLSAHVEGGYFRRTYQAEERDRLNTAEGSRFLLTSIYYLLTRDQTIGHWNLNKSDILHYYHLGDPIEYTLIHPDGRLEKIVMGSDIKSGEKLQLHVKGGIWKRAKLLNSNAGYGLISEAVSPGFEYEDMTLGDVDRLSKIFPQHETIIKAYNQ